MTNQERMAWTSRVVSLPFHEALNMIVQQFLTTGDATLTGFTSPKSAREWEFNSRVETLQTAFEKFERAKITPLCSVKPG